MKTARTFAGAAALLIAGWAHAVPVTWTDTQLGSGNPVASGGVTLTTTNVGGGIGFIPGTGGFAGLWLGGNNLSGQYTLTFSQAVTSIEVEFDALSSTGTLPAETLSGFATNLGAVSIGYTDQGGTSFNGTTVTSTANDGQGTITFSGAAFSSFSFSHNQGAQAGFVIERVTINAVPEPASVLMLLAGLGILVCRRVGVPSRPLGST